MIKSERGLTLVELLAAITILGIAMTILSAVIINGMKASESTMTKQQIQQEANYIVETIRKEYLDNTEDNIILEISGDKLLMNGAVISEGYEFTLEETMIYKSDTSAPFKLTIEKDSLTYTINTTFSKLD